jgi:hypothetical protein
VRRKKRRLGEEGIPVDSEVPCQLVVKFQASSRIRIIMYLIDGWTRQDARTGKLERMSFELKLLIHDSLRPGRVRMTWEWCCSSPSKSGTANAGTH